MELQPLQPSQVRNGRDSAGQLVYVVKQGNEQEKSYTIQKKQAADIFTCATREQRRRLVSRSFTMAHQSIGTAIGAEKNLGNFFGRGAGSRNILEMAQEVQNERGLRPVPGDWEMVYAVAHKAPILENDIKYKQIGIASRTLSSSKRGCSPFMKSADGSACPRIWWRSLARDFLNIGSSLSSL